MVRRSDFEMQRNVEIGLLRNSAANPRRYGVFRRSEPDLHYLMQPGVYVPSSRAEHRSSRR